MPTTKVGIYRSYYGPIPTDNFGTPLPEKEWPAKRAHSWVVRWFGYDGQRYSRSCDTRKEAERLAEEKQKDVRDGRPDEPPTILLKEFAEMYLRLRSDLSERCREEHGRTLRYLREQLGEQRPLQRITPLDARQFMAWYRKRKVKVNTVSPSTVNKVLRECRRIFREAVDCQFIRVNPFDGIRPTKVSDASWHHVTPKEFQKLLDIAKSTQWQGMIALAYCCGLRLGEILNLTWDDIDFKGKTVRVVAKLGVTTVEAWTPKDKDMRIVPLPGPAAVPLTKLRVAGDHRQPYVFVLAKGPNLGKRIPRQNTWRDFDVIRRRAGLSACSMHDLRRSYCTNLAQAMPMHVVQELAGHSDIRTTRRFYVKVQPELMEEARRVLEKAVAS